MAGICLRGQPGWGQLFAPLTTVVNTFGGTWFTEDWQPGVDSPEFREATQFYVDLVREHGEVGAPQAGFTECLNNLIQGNAAMWYDATSAAGSLEAADSPVKGKIGYVAAPVVETDSSGWLYAWSWSIQQASAKKDAAWEFISWASSAEYEQLVGEELGWSKVPAGKRASTYENPDYLAEASAFRSEEHTSELQSRQYIVCRLLLEKKKRELTVGDDYRMRQISAEVLDELVDELGVLEIGRVDS